MKPGPEDVVVTGVGLVTPLGTGTAATSEGWRSGRTGVAPLRAFDASAFPWTHGAEVRDFDPRRHVPDRKAIKLMSRNARLAVAAAGDCLKAAGEGAAGDGDECGLFVACGYEVPEMDDVVAMMAGSRASEPAPDAPAPGRGTTPLSLARLFTHGRHQMNPIDALKVLPNMAMAHVAITWGLRGPNLSLGPWGASALQCVAEGARAIRRGACTCAVVGGTDSQTNPFLVSYLGTRGLLSERGSCDPFQPVRDGTVPGEGAAFLFLEPRARAQGRGARVLAWVRAGASHGDPLDEGPPWGAPRTSVGFTFAGYRALDEARWDTGDLHWLLADGWGTRAGDAVEDAAFQQLFAGRPPRRVATKGRLGHCGGAAGVLDLGLALTTLTEAGDRVLVWASDPSGAVAAVAVQAEGPA